MTERIHVEISGDGDDLRRELRASRRELSDLRSEVEKSRRPMRAAADDNDSATRSFRELSGSARNFNMSLTTTRNAIRLVKPAALITGVGLLGGALNSAAAGAGALVSSLGPLVGLLPAAGQGALTFAQAAGTVKLATSGLSEALKAHAQDAKATGTAAASSAKQQVTSARAVADAKRNLAETQETATDAQRGLTDARKEARAELNALRFAAENAALAERGAELGLRRAQAQRRQAMRDLGKGTGSLLDVDEADLGVAEAKLALREARRAKQEQAREEAELRRRGVEGSKQVVAAQEAIADASRASAAAARQLSRAQQDSVASMEKAAGAASAYDEALKGLPASAQAFVKQLVEMQPLVDDLRQTAADGLLPGAGRGLASAARNFSEVNGVIAQTSKVLGALAEDAGELVGSKAWGRDISTIGASNARVLESGGDAALHLADAARHLIVEAAPLTEWLAESTERLAALAENEMRAKRETGELAEFFDEAREKASRLASIAQSLAAGLLEVGKAGKPLGDEILEDLDAAAQRWENWTKSVEGRNELQAYFTDAKPTLYEAGRLVDDLVTGFLKMGSSPATAELIRQLRVELLPVLLDVIETTTDEFGPVLVDALVEIAKVFGHLTGSSGPLTAFVDAIGKAAEGINWLLDNIPGLNDAIVTIAVGAGIYKALQIGAAITGIKTLHKLLRATPAAAATAGAAAGAGGAAAGGAAAGGAAAGGAGGLLARFAPKLTGRAILGRVAPPIGAYLGFTALLKTGIPDLEKITQKLDAFNAPGPKNTRLKQLTRDLDEAVKAGDASRMRKIATGIAQVGKATEGPSGPMIRDISRDIRRLADEKGFAEVRGQVKESAREFDIMREQTTGDIKAIRGAVSINAQRISADLGKHSREGKMALAANFRQAADAVKDSMDASGKTTKAGLREIERLMSEALKLYGFSAKQARSIARGNRLDSGPNEGSAGPRGLASGGYVGTPGERGRDRVPVALPAAWAVVNAHQQAALGLAGGGMVPAMVGAGELLASPEDQMALDERARARGFTGLDDVFARVTRPHYMARGGIVPIPGEPGESIHSSILADVIALKRRYKLDITDGYAASGHAAGGEHPKGLAIDAVPGAGGSWELVSQLAQWAEPQQNNPRHPFRWVGYTGDANHGPGDHIHLSWLAGAHMKGLGADAIKRVKWKGPAGAVGQIGQRVLDNARSGAQLVVDKAASSMGGLSGIGAGGPTGKGAASRSQMVAWAREALERTGIFPATAGNIEKLLLLAKQESSWVVRSINNWDSNAAAGNPSGGLMHVTLDKVGGSMARLFDPVDNMMTSIRYQKDRYGRLVTFSPYAAGKPGKRRSPRVGRGNTAQGRGTARRPRKKAKPKRLRPLSGINLGRLDAFDDELGLAEENYGRVERRQGLTDESQTRQITLPLGPAAFAGVLAAQPLEASWLRSVNTGEDLEVEVRDEAGISAHVSELQHLQTLKAEIAGLVRKQRRAARGVLRELRQGIKARVKLLDRVKRQLADTVKQLKKTRARIKGRNDRIRDLRRGSESAGQRKAIRDLTAANGTDQKQVTRLVGDKGDLERYVATRRGGLGDWRGSLDEVEDRDAQFSGTLSDLQLDTEFLQKDINAWRGTSTPAPKISGSVNEGARADLLQGLLDESLRANFLQAQQFGALRGFAPLLAGRMLGSFAHGALRVPETGMAFVHRDETILPDPQGPYGSQLPAAGAAARFEVDLVVRTPRGELVEIVDQRVRQIAPGVSSRVTGRSSRLISAAPGR